MSVRIDGIHPAKRIGKMILKRSKRSRLRFVIVSPNCMPVGCGNWPITVNPLAASGKGECRQAWNCVRCQIGICELTRLAEAPDLARGLPVNGERLLLSDQRDCQTGRCRNYEDR